MTPDEIAARVATTMLEREGFGPAFDVKIIHASATEIKISMPITEVMLNGHGTAHGGMVFALADSAFAYICNNQNKATVAHHTSITFLRPANVGDILTATGTLSGTKGRSGVYDIKIENQNNETVAIFQGLSRRLGDPIFELDGEA